MEALKAFWRGFSRGSIWAHLGKLLFFVGIVCYVVAAWNHGLVKGITSYWPWWVLWAIGLTVLGVLDDVKKHGINWR